jgi:putative transposase
MPIHFHPLDPEKTVRIYRRNLPHWRQDGATYFVTFRLSDSLLNHLVQELDCIRRMLIAENIHPTALMETDREYFRSMKRFLDQGHGACWLREPEIKHLVITAMGAFDLQRYEWGDYAVMPNHVHVLVRPLSDFDLEDVLHGWKGYTGREINRRFNRHGAVWQTESYDRLVRNSLEFERTCRYIRNNGKPFEEKDTHKQA